MVTEGQSLRVEKLNEKDGATIKLDTLLVADGTTVDIGAPVVKTSVSAKVMNQGLADKIHVVKFKSKVRYRRNRGHRQPFTQIQIEKI